MHRSNSASSLSSASLVGSSLPRVSASSSLPKASSSPRALRPVPNSPWCFEEGVINGCLHRCLMRSDVDHGDVQTRRGRTLCAFALPQRGTAHSHAPSHRASSLLACLTARALCRSAPAPVRAVCFELSRSWPRPPMQHPQTGGPHGHAPPQELCFCRISISSASICANTPPKTWYRLPTPSPSMPPVYADALKYGHRTIPSGSCSPRREGSVTSSVRRPAAVPWPAAPAVARAARIESRF